MMQADEKNELKERVRLLSQKLHSRKAGVHSGTCYLCDVVAEPGSLPEETRLPAAVTLVQALLALQRTLQNAAGVRSASSVHVLAVDLLALGHLLRSQLRTERLSCGSGGYDTSVFVKWVECLEQGQVRIGLAPLATPTESADLGRRKRKGLRACLWCR